MIGCKSSGGWCGGANCGACIRAPSSPQYGEVCLNHLWLHYDVPIIPDLLTSPITSLTMSCQSQHCWPLCWPLWSHRPFSSTCCDVSPLLNEAISPLKCPPFTAATVRHVGCSQGMHLLMADQWVHYLIGTGLSYFITRFLVHSCTLAGNPLHFSLWFPLQDVQKFSLF